MTLKTVFLPDDTAQAINELAEQQRIREELAKIRKNAGEGQLIRMIIDAGLPIIKRQFQN